MQENIIENSENEVGALEQKTKKRKIHAKDWKKNAIKIKRNKGESYMTTRGKIVPATQMGPPCSEKCIFKCRNKFSEEERQNLFTSYWAIQNLQDKRQFMLQCMRTHSADAAKIRRWSNKFFLKNSAGTSQRVCKFFFSEHFMRN